MVASARADGVVRRSLGARLIAPFFLLACQSAPEEPEPGSTSRKYETSTATRKVSLSPENAHFATARLDASGNIVTSCVQGLVSARSTVSPGGASSSTQSDTLPE